MNVANKLRHVQKISIMYKTKRRYNDEDITWPAWHRKTEIKKLLGNDINWQGIAHDGTSN